MFVCLFLLLHWESGEEGGRQWAPRAMAVEKVVDGSNIEETSLRKACGNEALTRGDHQTEVDRWRDTLVSRADHK